MAAEYVPYDGPIVTRAEAKAGKLKWYFTGMPCMRGHISRRYSSIRMCEECRKRHGRLWVAENPERHRSRVADWRTRNPEKNAALNRSSKARASNKERAKRRRAVYDAANLAALAATKREWCRRNPLARKKNDHNRRARKKSAGGRHSVADIKDLMRLQRGKCAWCRVKLTTKFHVDHVVALVNGGRNDKANLVLACQPCNSRKSSKDPLVFARERGLLI